MRLFSLPTLTRRHPTSAKSRDTTGMIQAALGGAGILSRVCISAGSSRGCEVLYLCVNNTESSVESWKGFVMSEIFSMNRCFKGWNYQWLVVDIP